MKRAQIDLAALVFAALGVTALTALGPDTAVVSPIQAQAEAAEYLDHPPISVRRHGQNWRVTDGTGTATMDGRTGELVEIDFGARQGP